VRAAPEMDGRPTERPTDGRAREQDDCRMTHGNGIAAEIRADAPRGDGTQHTTYARAEDRTVRQRTIFAMAIAAVCI
jgi:hypothetical protein